MKTKIKHISSYKLKDSWKNNRSRWGHSLHKMASRTGSFPPALAHYFIIKYSNPGQIVLDCYSGKGTVPLEACLNNRIGIGNDLAPEAYILTSAKINPPSLIRFKEYLRNLKEEMDENVSIKGVDKNVKLFFHPRTLKQLVSLQKISLNDDSKESIFFKAIICGILHGNSKLSLSLPCSHSFSMSPAYVRRYVKKHGLKKPYKDVLSSVDKRVEILVRDGLPKIKGKSYNKNILELKLKEKYVNLIVTSPPYFEKQTYAWDNWLRLWFLGYDYKNIRKTLFETSSKDKYFAFMEKNLAKMYNFLSDDSAAFIVVGDSKVNGTVINIAEMLVPSAQKVGFKVKRIIDDPIPKNKKYFTFINDGDGIRKDRILELHKGNVKVNDVKITWN